MWPLLLLIGASSAFAEVTVHRFDGEKVYRVTPRNEDEVHALNHLANIMQVDFWRPDSVELVKAEMTVDFRIEADRCSEVESILQHHGLNYEILINNLQAALDRQLDNRARTAGYNYEKYNSWEKIGNPGENKKAIFIDCGFHAREWISPAFCQWFVREAVRTYGKETIMTRLLNNLDFYVLPVMNIDGYVYSWTKSRMWRKTRSVNAGTTCIAVGASTNPCSETYCGSKPESEKETKALTDFIRRNRSTIKAYLTIHSYSQMLLYPYSYTYKLTPNNVKLNSVAKGAIRELATLYGTEYTYGPGAATIYPAAGGSDDWAYDQGIQYSFTFELRDKGRYGFALPESQIKPTCEETMIAVKYIAEYILNYHDKVFRVKLENENQLNLDFWHPHSVQYVLIGKEVDFRVSSDQTNFVQKILEQNQIQYRILFHNLQDEIEKQLDGGKRFRKKYFYTRYNEWEKIAAWTKRMAKKHAKLVSRIEIGKTYEERPMYVLKVGKQSYQKKAIFMDCGIHAREWISPAFCQWFVKEAVMTYGIDKDMTLLLDNINFYVLPVFNIDGYVWTWTKDRMWRKNRSNNSNSDCIGTDLNRNFKASWGSDNYEELHDPCELVYCGSIDWAYDEGIKYSFGFELRDRGQYGFLLPESQIKPTCKETMLAIKVFRVKPQNEKEVSMMKSLPSLIQVDFWYPDSALHIVKQMEVDFHVSAAQSNTAERLLKQNGIPYQIIFDNLQEDIEKQLDGDKNDGYSYEKYNEWDKIGKKSGEGNAIFMDCGVHAREWISPAFCQWFVKEAISTYGKNRDMTHILDNMNFYIVPIVNIDGYVWSWTQNRFWRKNRSNASHSNCIGVDINRNFDAAWNTADSSKNPCEETYCGSAPESEPETKAVASFIRSHLSSIKGYLTMHSYSQMILFPFGYTYEKTANYNELNELAKRAVKAIASLYDLSSGCSDDWVFNQGIKYSFTFELRDKGKYGFLLPESQIKPTCQEIMLAVKLIASYILNKIL
ncbi:Carboxypeptidase B, partial [Ophiophagus hannah]